MSEPMLLRLALSNFVIVESAELEFAAGLNVLTGETGAGKSILVDALSLLAGGRASGDLVRAGAERLSIEAHFSAGPTASQAEIPWIDEDGGFAVRRELWSDGRGRVTLGGETSRIGLVREALRPWLRLVQQGESHALEEGPFLESLLDREAGSEALAQQYRIERSRWRDLCAEEATLAERVAAFEREEEWIRYQLAEITQLDPRPGEAAELERELASARQAQEECEDLARALDLLIDAEGSALDRLETAAHRTKGDASEWKARADDLARALRELGRELRDRLERANGTGDVDLDPEALEERLVRLERLRKKHGGSDEALTSARRLFEDRLAENDADRKSMARIGDARARAAQACAQSADALSQARREAAIEVSRAAQVELRTLGMAGAGLAFQFDRAAAEDGLHVGEGRWVAGEGGIDRVHLRFRSHSSQPWGALHRIASGGELSRVLLALQVAWQRPATATGGTWIFDEIDAGVGGETALRMAERLARLARTQQVLLVTHSAAVAARADRHFTVEKEISRGRPRAAVHRVEGDERLSELARMLSGDPASSVARRHARELLEGARSR